ncbi:MAG: divergent polysaccharide deacetylase family protein [Pontibacterium sp.]
MNKPVLNMLLGLIISLMTMAGGAHAEPFQSRMVLVIDDMGYNRKLGEAALALPGALTYSILPYTPYAKRFAEQAHQSGREVMLHAPMANTRNKALGPGALTAEMDAEAITSALNAALDEVPHVAGVNNHMGSRLTGMIKPMQWVMDTIKTRNLYFIDSITTVKALGWKVARDNNVRYLKRHVFLDHEASAEFIHRQFSAALDIAKKHGYVVVIGHPYAETIHYLKKALPELQSKGVRLVSASDIVEPEVKRQLTERARRQLQLADASEKQTQPIAGEFKAD